jgi:hypothetical protein
MSRRRILKLEVPATRLTAGFTGIAAVILILLLIQLYLGGPPIPGA